jgi:hypothetical protein
VNSSNDKVPLPSASAFTNSVCARVHVWNGLYRNGLCRNGLYRNGLCGTVCVERFVWNGLCMCVRLCLEEDGGRGRESAWVSECVGAELKGRRSFFGKNSVTCPTWLAFRFRNFPNPPLRDRTSR